MTNDQHCECDRRQTTRRLSEADNFFDGTSGVHDFTDIIAQGGTMVEPLQDPDLFKREFISMGVLTWPNGFDLDAIRLLQEIWTLFFPAISPSLAIRQPKGVV